MCLPNILFPVFMFAFIFPHRSYSPCWPLAFLISHRRFELLNVFLPMKFVSLVFNRGGGYCHIMGYIGMCCCQAVYSRIGYISQSVWKLISWLKILSKLGIVV